MCLFLSPFLVPQGTHVPYQLHYKQTAAGSVRLPGIRLREGERRGSREERRKKKGRGEKEEKWGAQGGIAKMTKRGCWRRGSNRDREGRRGCVWMYLCVICLGDWAAEGKSSLVLSVLYSSSLSQVNTLNTQVPHTLEWWVIFICVRAHTSLCVCVVLDYTVSICIFRFIAACIWGCLLAAPFVCVFVWGKQRGAAWLFVCVCVCVCVGGGKTFFTSPKNMGDSHSHSRSISVGVLAGLMQSFCKQVINGSEHCSYGWRAEAGGASLEESWRHSEQWRDFHSTEKKITPASTWRRGCEIKMAAVEKAFILSECAVCWVTA